MANDLTYGGAGVDIDAGERLVDAIKPLAASTSRQGIAAMLGGFGGVFDPKAAGYDDPLMVLATDGVGTKLKLAQSLNAHNSIGIDLVAMCVNDLIVQGAEPLAFLDYFSCSKLSVATATAIIAGIAEGCKQANCTLLGGETAEMPGFYLDDEYDLAGFAVGAVERHQLLDKAHVQQGDRLLGLAANGIHSNGFSLVRKILEVHNISLESRAEFDTNSTLGASLLTPTRIYVKPILNALKLGGIHGICHITGGGIYANMPRVYGPNLTAKIALKSWQRPAIFDWLQQRGPIETHEMLKTFNCGIGMVVIAAADRADSIAEHLTIMGEKVWDIGVMVPRQGNDAVLIEV